MIRYEDYRDRLSDDIRKIFDMVDYNVIESMVRTYISRVRNRDIAIKYLEMLCTTAIDVIESSDTYYGLDKDERPYIPYHYIKIMEDIGLVVTLYRSRKHHILTPVRPELILDAIKKIDELTRSIEIDISQLNIVYGYDDVKDIVIRSLTYRDPIHILFVGPSSSGKTLFLYAISRAVKPCLYISAHNMTREGLRDAILMYRPYAIIIDEIDKVKHVTDLSILLELMDSGYISIARAGNVDRVYVGSRVYASCNNIDRIERYMPELLSRFIVIRFSEYTKDEFIAVSIHVLKSIGVDESIAREIATRLADRTRDVRKAINIAKLIKDRKDVDSIISILSRYGYV